MFGTTKKAGGKKAHNALEAACRRLGVEAIRRVAPALARAAVEVKDGDDLVLPEDAVPWFADAGILARLAAAKTPEAQATILLEDGAVAERHDVAKRALAAREQRVAKKKGEELTVPDLPTKDPEAAARSWLDARGIEGRGDGEKAYRYAILAVTSRGAQQAQSYLYQVANALARALRARDREDATTRVLGMILGASS